MGVSGAGKHCRRPSAPAAVTGRDKRPNRSRRARRSPPSPPRPPIQEEHPHMRLSSLRTPAALAAGLASLALAAPAGAAPATVTVGSDYFQSNNVTVNTGEAVTWQWKGSGHNVAFKTGPEKI